MEDSIILRKYIKSIQLLNVDNKIENESLNEVAEELQPDLPTMPKPVKLYLCEDNVCPICNYQMEEKYTSFTEINNGQLDKKTISTYKCTCCNRFFVCDFILDELSGNKSNLHIIKDYYFKVPQIDINSVIVLSNTSKCSFQHHTRDITVQLPALNKEGEIHYVGVSASYCFDCGRFTILKDEFDKISDVVTCKVIDETTNYKLGETNQDHESEDDVSILKCYGYNVQTQKNISEQQRHIILSSIIEAGIMNRRQVVDQININIKRKSTRPDCALAIQKWQDDIDYVNTYKADNLPEVVFDKIVLKYRQCE